MKFHFDKQTVLDSRKVTKPFGEKPKKIGDYTVLQCIDSGMADNLYLANRDMDTTPGEKNTMQVMIRLLPKRIRDDELDACGDFLRELCTLSCLLQNDGHPNVVPICDAGYCDQWNKLYMCMEYVEGELLAKRVAIGALAEKHALQIALGVARGLEYAFQRQIVHSWVQPGNIMIDKRSCRARVIGLGMEGVKMVWSHERACDGIISEMPYYTSPESIRSRDISHQSAIYSLGAILYYMVSGRPPYAEMKEPLDVLRAIISKEPVPLRELVPTISEPVVVVVNKAMARDKNNRYTTASQLIEDMNRVSAACGYVSQKGKY